MNEDFILNLYALEKADHEQTKDNLAAEKAAHEETRRALELLADRFEAEIAPIIEQRIRAERASAAATEREKRLERALSEARLACEAVLHWYEEDSTEFNRDIAIEQCRAALGAEPTPLSKDHLLDLLRSARGVLEDYAPRSVVLKQIEEVLGDD